MASVLRTPVTNLCRERKFSPKFLTEFFKSPWGHGRPRLRVMDVRTKMLVFPGIRGPDSSFCPRTSAGYPRGRPRDIRPQNLLFGLLFRSWLLAQNPISQRNSQSVSAQMLHKEWMSVFVCERRVGVKHSPVITKWMCEWKKRAFRLRKKENEEHSSEPFAHERRKVNGGHWVLNKVRQLLEKRGRHQVKIDFLTFRPYFLDPGWGRKAPGTNSWVFVSVGPEPKSLL